MPLNYAKQIFEYQLENPPVVDLALNDALVKFVRYLRSFWLSKIDMICVWDDYPRTTNIVEGYNNGMKTSFKK